MKNYKERRNYIIKKITINKEVKVEELSKELHVSKETIRTDLNYLEQKGIVYRIHGGAQLRGSLSEIPYDIRKQEASDIKKKLAYKALDLIKNDSVLFVASSSTNYYLSSLLRLKKNLVIYTNNIDLLFAMKDTKHTLYLIGGEYYEAGKRLIGPYAIEMIKDIHFDTCISSMDGCANMMGPATKSNQEHIFIKTILKNSQTKILMCDSHKFMEHAHYKYADFKDFNYIITQKIPENVRKTIKKDNIIEILE